ncbi:hypothetical protein AAFF_G00092960 [Aldrovandia affinis]|uniref:Uncharacterized protein n=1 Tax=Aldrovandia affinis TaxID=143900 RepID=A0AAD7T2P2_9TELE|nr:hypothetical protein AAFF_G00092960 [Aldrovandia affinis]
MGVICKGQLPLAAVAPSKKVSPLSIRNRSARVLCNHVKHMPIIEQKVCECLCESSTLARMRNFDHDS